MPSIRQARSPASISTARASSRTSGQRKHLREGASRLLCPSPGIDGGTRLWKEIHDLQADTFARGIAEGIFIDDDPHYLAETFSAMDQVLLADWVAGGMKADRRQLVRRFQNLVERAFCR